MASVTTSAITTLSRPTPTSIARRRWTGEDSNLRSPQGAADLQSAGFSHSPTRPAKQLDTTIVSLKHSQSRTGLRYGIAAMQKRLVSADTSPSAFIARNPSVFRKKPDPSEPSWRRDLNPRPSDYKSDALPTELRQPCSNRAKVSHRQLNCKQALQPGKSCARARL